jgi:hypothetical protein
LAPALSAGPGRTIYLAWTVGEDRSADIHVSVSTDGGASFGEPRIVAPSPGYSDAPKIAVDGRGVLHLACAESSGGLFAPLRIRYTRSFDGARSFEAPREISAAGAGFPALALDASANVYVLWELFRDARCAPRGLALAVSRDAGRSFSAPGAAPGSALPGPAHPELS